MNDRAIATFEDAYRLWLTALNQSYRELVETAAALVPSLLGAAMLLVVGWLLAVILGKLILRLATGLDRVSESLNLRTGTDAVSARWPASRIVAVAVYWLVILFFVTVAADVLGLDTVSQLSIVLLAYLPTLLLTAAVLFAFVALSDSIASAVERGARKAGVESAAAVAAFVRLVLIAMAAIIALGQVGIDTTLLVNVFSVVAATLFAGAALAFGLGASSAVRNIIAAHHARRAYRIGQRVRIGDEEGEILELSAVSVVLETGSGRTLVPARLFDERVSVLVDSDAGNA